MLSIRRIGCLGGIDLRFVAIAHGEERGDLYFTKDMLLAVGDRYKAQIDAAKAADAPYR